MTSCFFIFRITLTIEVTCQKGWWSCQILRLSLCSCRVAFLPKHSLPLWTNSLPSWFRPDQRKTFLFILIFYSEFHHVLCIIFFILVLRHKISTTSSRLPMCTQYLEKPLNHLSCSTVQILFFKLVEGIDEILSCFCFVWLLLLFLVRSRSQVLINCFFRFLFCYRMEAMNMLCCTLRCTLFLSHRIEERRKLFSCIGFDFGVKMAPLLEASCYHNVWLF